MQIAQILRAPRYHTLVMMIKPRAARQARRPDAEAALEEAVRSRRVEGRE